MIPQIIRLYKYLVSKNYQKLKSMERFVKICLPILVIGIFLLVEYYLRKAGLGRVVELGREQEQKQTEATSTQDRGHQEDPLNNKTKVLILARWRSGSTFTGNLFSKNKNCFYLFEPLYDNYNLPQRLHHNNLTKPEQSFITSTLNNFYNHCGMPKTSIDRFFARDSKSSKSKRQRGSIRAKIMQEECLHDEKYGIMATKTIRLKSLSWLPESLRLNGNENHNLKIIYLVRDPRAIANSRFTRSKLWNYPEDIDRLDNICKSYDLFIKERKENEKEDTQSKTFKNKILVIRYEDLSKQPLKMSQKIYNFINKPLPEYRVVLD